MDRPTATPSRTSPRIVLLEDELGTAKDLELLLRWWFRELDLVVFSNGDEAWTDLCRQDPDLFITDWFHPGLSGAEILRKLADRKVAYPIIFCSVCPREAFKEQEALLELKLVWLQKPFSVEEFRTHLSNISGLGLRLKRNGVDV
jgi:DNA-binding response OmpR family regulator